MRTQCISQRSKRLLRHLLAMAAVGSVAVAATYVHRTSSPIIVGAHPFALQDAMTPSANGHFQLIAKRGSAPSQSTAEANLYAGMRSLWTQHMDLTLAAVQAYFSGQGFDQAAADLLQNQVDIGNAIKPIYGDAAGNALTQLLQQHIFAVVDVLQAAQSGNAPALNQAIQGAYANANEIGVFLASANPYWSQEYTTEMLKMHITQTLVYATDVQTGRAADGEAAYNMAKQHMLEFADALSAGIVQQFPNQFR